MRVHEFSFGKIIKHSHNVAEFKLNEGIDLTDEMFEEYLLWLKASLDSPCKLLMHYIDPKRITFDVKLKMGGLSSVLLAIISHKAIFNKDGEVDSVSKVLMASQRANGVVIELFDDYHEAFSWLEKQ